MNSLDLSEEDILAKIEEQATQKDRYFEVVDHNCQQQA